MSIARRITEVIVKALIDLKVPWRGDFGFSKNILSRQRYDGVNPLLLNLAAECHGWTSSFWGTQNQWLSQGFSTKTITESQEIVLYNPPSSGRMKHGLDRSLFNLNQIPGGFADLRKPLLDMNSGTVDHVIRSTSAAINFKPTLEAAYYYAEDIIVFPLRWQFVKGPGGLPAFYNSLFHELAHWTEPRLGWEGSTAEREMLAEITSDYLCTELNVPRLPMSMRTNHKSFLDEWVGMMQKDSDLIFRITAAASRATDFILSFSQMVEPRHNSVMGVV